MIFYFNSDGKLINSVPSNVYQGSNKASRIYFVCPTAQSNVISVAFTLPSGLYSSKRMITRTELTGDGIGLSSGNGKVVNEEDVGFNVWQYDIPFSVTEYAGQVTVQFFIDNGTETFATQPVTFLVEKGSGVVPPNISDDEYQEIVETIVGYYQSTADNLRELDQRLSQEIAEKQDALVNGVNIKTINGQPILGAGDIIIEGGGGGSGGTLVVDGALSSTSTNPVENRVVYQTKQELLSAINTKPIVHVLSYSDNFSSSGTFKDSAGNIITPNTGNYINQNVRNYQFNSQDASITILGDDTEYIIARISDSESASLANGYYFLVLTVNEFSQENNKIIRIVTGDVPDRWASYGKTCYEVDGGINDYSRYGSSTVTAELWTEITGVEPYTHKANLLATNVLNQQEINNKNCVFTLFNNNAVLFAKHGFAVYSVASENLLAPVVATILSIGAPTENITFSFKGEVIE